MKTIIIVEGKSDTRRLKEIYPDVVTFETNGLGLDEQKINKLKLLASEGVELICMTDPDFPGEKIRATLSEEIPSVKHAYVKRAKAKAKNGKIGIESTTDEEIKRSLTNLFKCEQPLDIYDLSFMMEMGLAGDKTRRDQFCNKLGIATGNNKKVIKQLNSFAIPPKDVIKVIGELDED